MKRWQRAAWLQASPSLFTMQRQGFSLGSALSPPIKHFPLSPSEYHTDAKVSQRLGHAVKNADLPWYWCAYWTGALEAHLYAFVK